MKNIVSFLHGFGWGLTFGGVAVLLTTPHSGSEVQTKTSTWFKQTAQEWRKIRDERRAELEAQLVDLTKALS